MDRNQGVHYDNYNLHWSLSARRVWIEITYVTRLPRAQVVALRKESVDRNPAPKYHRILLRRSLSARRVWIEIPAGCWRDARRAVALRKESVDRNFDAVQVVIVVVVALRKESVDRNMLCLSFRLVAGCRSPQGECG